MSQEVIDEKLEKVIKQAFNDYKIDLSSPWKADYKIFRKEYLDEIAEERAKLITDDSIDQMIGPGVHLLVKDLEGSDGKKIELEGTFRDGGVDNKELLRKIEDFWKTIDID